MKREITEVGLMIKRPLSLIIEGLLLLGYSMAKWNDPAHERGPHLPEVENNTHFPL